MNQPEEGGKPCIQMIEDEEDIAFLIHYLLERQGFMVEHAADGRQALERFESQAIPQLVLMDIMLPYHDGLELLERLRHLAAWQEVPVLMLTAKAREADIVRALELGGGRLCYQTLPAGGVAGTYSPFHEEALMVWSGYRRQQQDRGLAWQSACSH